MKKKILSLMLIVVMALAIVACNSGNNNQNGAVSTESSQVAEKVDGTEASNNEAQVLGEGTTVFAFTVVDKDGNETAFEIHTDKVMVGEALLEVGLLEGEESDYGLFVKAVNGITADYNADGVYWAFYVNGEYAVSGVDTTPISEGESYMFKVEKA